MTKKGHSGIKYKHTLKHPARNLKKIARLPPDDRKQVLKILMKKVNRRKEDKKSKALSDAICKGNHATESSSSTSVNNDWKNYVALRGKDEAVYEDINCFGKSLGVKLYNDKANQFQVLSRGRNSIKKRVEKEAEGSLHG